MLKQALPLLLLLGFPAAVVSQTPSLAPQRAAPPKLIQPIPAAAEKQQRFEEELQRVIASQEALAKEIQRLRNVTGQHQQIVVSVEMYELSLRKARNMEFNVAGVDSRSFHPSGFRGALSASVFDEPRQAEGAVQVESGREAVCTKAIENGDSLRRVVAELKRAGALKVLANSTLTTVSGRPATLHVGGELPIPVPQPDGESTTEFRTFGTELHVVPVLVGNGRIQLALRSRISEVDSSRSVGLGDTTAPALRVREVDTGVEVGVGHTFVLAGLVQRRAVHNSREQSGDADKDQRPGLNLSNTPAGAAGPNQDATEEFELVVMVRAETLAAPELEQ